MAYSDLFQPSDLSKNVHGQDHIGCAGGSRSISGPLKKQLQRFQRIQPVFLLVGQHRQSNQIPDAHAVARRKNRIIGVFGPCQQFFVMVRGEEEPAAVLVPKHSDLIIGQTTRRVQPRSIAGCTMQSQQTLDQEGVSSGYALNLAVSVR